MLKHEKAILLAILFLGAFVRFWGLDFCLLLGREGWVFLPLCRVDEELTWAVALRFFSGDLNPHFFNYPSLLPYAVFVLDAIYLAGKLLFAANGSLELLKQSIAVNPSDLILLSRGFVALLGTLTIFLVYRIAQIFPSPQPPPNSTADLHQKIVGGSVRALWRTLRFVADSPPRGEGRVRGFNTTGILSAFFLAFAYLHVRDSHFATTDVPMAFMVCLAYLFIIDIFQKGRWKDYLLAGLFSGLATSTKWPAFLLFIPILVAHFLKEIGDGSIFNKGRENRTVPIIYTGERVRVRGSVLSPKLLFALFLIPFAAILGTPFAVLSPHEFLQDMQRLSQTHSQTDWRGIRLGIGWIYHFKFTLWYGLGWPLFLASLLGVGGALKRNWKAGFLLLSFALPYYFLIGKQYLVFMRYMVPLIPFCCIFAGVFVASLPFPLPLKGERIKVRGLLLLILSILIVFPALYRVFWLDRALAKPDSRIVAGDWIHQNIPKNKKLILMSLIMGDPAIDIPRSTIGDSYWARRFEWPPRFLNTKLSETPYHYFRILPETYSRNKDFLDKAQYEYLIVDHSPLLARSATKEVLQDLMDRFDLVKVFRGVGEDRRMIFDRQDGFYVPVAGAQYTERSGPDISILKKRGIG